MYESIPKPQPRQKTPKPLQRKTPLKPSDGFRKWTQNGLPKKGSIFHKWVQFRAEWLGTHPPDDKGEYECGICHHPVHFSEVTLDHKIPRSRAPQLRFDPGNIQPAHWSCNFAKGSRTQLVDGTLQ